MVLAVADGLIPAIRLSDLLAPNQPFVHALECRQIGKAIVKYFDRQEPQADVETRLPKATVHWFFSQLQAITVVLALNLRAGLSESRAMSSLQKGKTKYATPLAFYQRMPLRRLWPDLQPV